MDSQITDEYDREFLALIMDIEKRIQKLNKYDKLRVESWCKKLCQVTNNVEWKKNRNLHAICLMDMILNNRFEEPYNKFAPEGSLPILSKTLVKSRLSQKFWKCTEKIYDEISKKDNEIDNENQMENEIEENYEMYNNENVDEKVNNLANEMAVQKLKSGNRRGNYENSKNNNNNLNNDAEIEKLKLLIGKLQNDIAKKDSIIQSQKEEKNKLNKRIDELERMLSSFLALEKEQS